MYSFNKLSFSSLSGVMLYDITLYAFRLGCCGATELIFLIN